MNIFGKKIPDKKDDQPADQTTPGVRMLKEVWDIKTEKKQDRVDGPVSSDIYARKPRVQGIPPRYHGQRVQE